jgi:histidinol-phosphate aminotransferase
MSCDYIQLATQGVRGLHAYQPGKPIEELQRELGLSEVIKLASNENPLGAGEKARAAVRESVADLGRYPDGFGFTLKSVLSEATGAAADCITLGNGSNDILDMVARGFANEHHEIVFSEHAFAVYALATQAVGAHAVVVPAKDWGHDLDAMAAAVTQRTRVVFVANPNNPTGTWSDEASLRRFVEQLPESVLVVIDEAYREYVTEPSYPNSVPWVAKHANIIVSRSFSKIHGLAGLRVGYAVSNPVVADIMNRVRHPFNVNVAALAGAAAAVTDVDHIEKSVSLNAEQLQVLASGFSRLGLSFIESVGNFICVNVGRDAGSVNDALLHRGIIVRPVAGYGMPNHLRITVGLESENRQFLEALEQVLND